MESSGHFLDDTTLSELRDPPQACSTVKQERKNRCRPIQHEGEQRYAVNRLFTTMSMDEVLEDSLTGDTTASTGNASILSLPNDPASRSTIIDQAVAELPSFLAASKQRLSCLVSRSVRESAGRLLPRNVRHPKDAGSAERGLQRATVESSQFQALGDASGVDGPLSSSTLPAQDLPIQVSLTPTRNPLAEASALDVARIFGKCTVGSTFTQDPQVHSHPEQVNGPSTSVGGASRSTPDKVTEFSGFEHCQGISLEGEEFYSSGAAEAMLKEDEEQFSKGILKGLLPQVLSESLQDTVGPQDITRPLWMGDDASRISVGTYMRGRSAQLSPVTLDLKQVPTKKSKAESSERVLAESLQDLVLDNLGLDRSSFLQLMPSAAVPGSSSASVSNLPTTACQDESCVQPLSLSTIDRVLEEISLSEGADAVSRRLVQAFKLPNPTRKVEAKENVPPKALANIKERTTSSDDEVFKRPLPLVPRKKPNSRASDHGGSRHIQMSCVSSCPDLSPRKTEYLGAERSTSPRAVPRKCEAREKMPARFPDAPRGLAEDPAWGRSDTMLPSAEDACMADSPSTSVSCGASRTCEWVLKSHMDAVARINFANKGSQQLLQGSVPHQLPEDKMPASWPCSAVGTQVLSGTTFRLDKMAHKHVEGDQSTRCARVTAQTGTLLGSERGPVSTDSTSNSIVGSSCSTVEQPWSPCCGSALVQQRNLSAPSCSSLSSGSDIRPAVMVIPGELGHPNELDLGCVCVGVVKKAVLTLINPSQHTMRYTLKWSECTFDSRLVDSPDFVDITFPKVVAVDGLQTVKVKGSFVSRKPGRVGATIKVQPLHRSSEPDTILSVSLRASVEWPQLHVEVPQEFEGLEYGGPQRAGTLTVTNKGSCAVPLKIMIVEGQGAFSLNSKPTETDRKANVQVNAFTIFTSVPAGKNADFTVVCCPQNARSLCCSAKVQIFLSGTYASTELLESIPMSTTIAPPKLSVEGKRGVVMVLDMEEKVVTLENRGEHVLQVELRSSTSCFAVGPKLALIEPRSNVLVTIVLVGAPASMDDQPEGVLQAIVRPYGIVLNLAKLEGKLQGGNLGVPQPSASCVSQPPKSRTFVLESNKRAVVWPGVQVGDSVTKSIVFRNPSSTCITANLTIREHHGSCFKVSIKGKDSPSHVVSCCIQPRESVEVSITFCPTSVRFVHSRLLIRGQGPGTMNNKSISLFGFGGKSQVDLLGLSTLGHGGYIVDLGTPTVGEEVRREFTLFNGGDWDCFVLFSFCQNGPTSDAQLGEVKVSPECLVLKSKESRTVTLSAAVDRQPARRDEVVNLGMLKVLHGLEVFRQWAKRAAAECHRTPEAVAPFLVKFEGEKGSTDSITFSLNGLGDTFLKTVSQTAVVLSSGAAAIMMQASNTTLFIPVGDMSCFNDSELPGQEDTTTN